MSDLPFENHGDFGDADRGLIGMLEPCVIKDASGRVVWDNDAFSFLDGDCPDSANPGLWRQSQLCARQGLFEVTEGIYQVRGLDLSNMTIVEGDRGVVVIDPLISTETAAAALALYRRHRGDRPVTGVIYTHSHGDHFGGVRGVVTGDVPILAPAGFMEHAVEENVYAGGAMNRRAVYMYGAELDKAPGGQIGAGLGMTTSTGTVSLIPPTVDITRAENGPWRNFYLMGARELRHGAVPPSLSLRSPGMIGALTVEQLFDSVAIRVNGPKAWAETLTIDWDFTDDGSRHRTALSNGLLVHWSGPRPGEADLTVTLAKPQLLALLAGQGDGGLTSRGDLGALHRLLGLLDAPDPGFAIVTP